MLVKFTRHWQHAHPYKAVERDISGWTVLLK